MLVHRYAVIKELQRFAPALERDAALPGSRTENELMDSRPMMLADYGNRQSNTQLSITGSTSAPTGNLRLRIETTVVSFSEVTP